MTGIDGVLVRNFVRNFVRCAYCAKHRCINGKKQLSPEEDDMVKRKTDSRLCVGGSHLNEDSNAEHGQICIETVLHCSRPMETAISARKIIFARGLPVGLQSQVDEICYHCGLKEHNMTCFREGVYVQYHGGPLCDGCYQKRIKISHGKRKSKSQMLLESRKRQRYRRHGRKRQWL